MLLMSNIYILRDQFYFLYVVDTLLYFVDSGKYTCETQVGFGPNLFIDILSELDYSKPLSVPYVRLFDKVAVEFCLSSM